MKRKLMSVTPLAKRPEGDAIGTVTFTVTREAQGVGIETSAHLACSEMEMLRILEGISQAIEGLAREMIQRITEGSLPESKPKSTMVN